MHSLSAVASTAAPKSHLLARDLSDKLPLGAS